MSQILKVVVMRVAVPLLALITRFEVTPAANAGGGASQVLKADQLTKRQLNQQLRQLPDSAVIESRGQRLTVGEIKARGAQRAREALAKARASAAQEKARLDARLAQFEQQRQAKLAAGRAQAMAEFARLRQPEAIQEEAAQLLQRAKTASPGERAQIEQRAGQLLQQLGR